MPFQTSLGSLHGWYPLARSTPAYPWPQTGKTAGRTCLVPGEPLTSHLLRCVRRANQELALAARDAAFRPAAYSPTRISPTWRRRRYAMEMVTLVEKATCLAANSPPLCHSAVVKVSARPPWTASYSFIRDPSIRGRVWVTALWTCKSQGSLPLMYTMYVTSNICYACKCMYIH